MVRSVTSSTGSFLVDLSHLTLLDKNNLAINEMGYQGDKTQWKVSGIGKHPGDAGMQNIADQFFITINAFLSERPIR